MIFYSLKYGGNRNINCSGWKNTVTNSSLKNRGHRIETTFYTSPFKVYFFCVILKSRNVALLFSLNRGLAVRDSATRGNS